MHATAPKSTLATLFEHNDWANAKLLTLAARLNPEQLDRAFEMGCGSLRATLAHIQAAEDIWLQRWLGGAHNFSRAALHPDVSPGRLWLWFAETRARRNAFFASLGDAGCARRVTFKNRKGIRYTFPIGDMALHVTNHGVHHRAQALNMLRHVGVKLPGLDYIFMCCELPTVAHEEEARRRLREFGMDIRDEVAPPPNFEVDTIREYYRYGDCTTRLLLDLAEGLTDEQLDRPFEMGLGTLRKTLLHICDAESWWRTIWWTRASAPFDKLPCATPLADLRTSLDSVAAARNDLLNSLNNADLQQTVPVTPFPGLNLSYRIGESMLQLCCHGTHHRAQAINMLRHLGVPAPEVDYIAWYARECGQAN